MYSYPVEAYAYDQMTDEKAPGVPVSPLLVAYSIINCLFFVEWQRISHPSNCHSLTLGRILKDKALRPEQKTRILSW